MRTISSWFCGLCLCLLISFNTFAYHCPADTEIPSIRYLGVGAFDIRYQGQRILTDPFYSPQSLWDILSLSPYTSDKGHIKAALGAANKNVSEVLIGHGHYDHAADTPALNDYLTKNAQIIGSQSTQFLLAKQMKNHTLNGLTDNDFDRWHSIANGWVRIMPLASEHAPQALGINLFPHIHQHELETPPKYVWQWSQGVNINWVMDFLDRPGSKVVKQRIFLQTSASAFPIGAPKIKDNTPTDKIFLAAASFDHVDNYPTGLIKRLQPKQIVFIHWENFFKPWFEQPEPLSLIDFDTLMNNQTLANRAKDALIGQPGFCY